MVSCGTWHNIILCEKTKLMQVYSHFSCASSQGGWWQLPDDQWRAGLSSLCILPYLAVHNFTNLSTEKFVAL